MQITVAVFDMAGTTVTDDGLVLASFDIAATAAGIPEQGPERDAARQYVLDTMGQSKIEVFRALVDSEERAVTANAAFERAYEDAIPGGVTAVPGAAETITRLSDVGITTVFTTGFSPSTQHAVLDELGWTGLVDIVLAPGADTRGRPFPDLVLRAALAAQVTDVAEVAVVGDTANDILTGRRAGAEIVVGVLTGAHDERALRDAGASHVVASVAELPEIILPR